MKKKATDPAQASRDAGMALVKRQPILAPILDKVSILPDHEHRHVTNNGWLACTPAGRLWLHPKRRADAAHWARLIALAAACWGFGLIRSRAPQALWELTALLLADRFCGDLKIGQLPEDLLYVPPALPAGGEDSLFRLLASQSLPEELRAWHSRFTGGSHDLFQERDLPPPRWQSTPEWKKLLAQGLAQGVGQAVRMAAGETDEPEDDYRTRRYTRAKQAQRRLIDGYPLLGALAAGFSVEQDPRLCQHYQIRIAAIDVGARTIWINPAAGLSDHETLFVFAHELLHAGLNHASRRRGRDALLWNVACDFVINGWLKAMAVGTPPQGVLYDADFDTLSAEEIHDRLAQDIRRARKLATLRGVGECDLLGDDHGKPFIDAESYCRRALAQGFDRYELSGQRGILPAGLVEEIRSLAQPPIPWDVKLAQWFDEHFPPPELQRSYARPSRRQGATPDIPRPSHAKPPGEIRQARVFGVVLDTSGSMEPQLLGKALGAIASYALAREVHAVRLICCDAQAYDSGWMEPERLLDRFTLKGRGGTVLQPGMDLLHEQSQRGGFPKNGPLLIITDGFCEDRLDIPFEHAFLLPEGRRLPFVTRAEVFWVS